MNHREITLLIPELQQKAYNVIQRCRQQGVEISIYTTLRSLRQTAIYYRQSRDIVTITRKAEWLTENGYGFLAKILLDVGAHYGEHVTNATIGEDWHNYGQAFDACVIDNGKYAWDVKQYPDEWDIYGRAVKDEGLVWGGDWAGLSDYPHAQLPTANNPLTIFSPEGVYDMLMELNQL